MFDHFREASVSPVQFWIFVSVAIIIQGISKSGFAGGAGILSLPLMMLVMPPNLVSATLLPLLILCDLNAIYHHYNNKAWRKVLEIYLPTIPGIVLGAWVWWKIGKDGLEPYELALKRFVGIIAILFSLYIVGKEVALSFVSQYKPGWKTAIPAGIAAGFCSTIAHAAGPIVGLYLFAQGLGKTLFVGTTAWVFTLINLTKLPFYFGVGLVRSDVLLFDVLLVPLVPIGSFLGKWLHERVSERLFNWVIFVLTMVAGIQLLFNVRLVQTLLEKIF